MIEAALPGAEVEVVDETGTGDHLRATVSAPQFEGLSRLDQHRLVKAAVKPRFDDGADPRALAEDQGSIGCIRHCPQRGSMRMQSLQSTRWPTPS